LLLVSHRFGGTNKYIRHFIRPPQVSRPKYKEEFELWSSKYPQNTAYVYE